MTSRAQRFEHVSERWPDGDLRLGAWNDVSIPEIQRHRWPEFRTLLGGTSPLGVTYEAPIPMGADLVGHNDVMSFGYVIGRAVLENGNRNLSVLDWGGGIGQSAMIARSLWPDLDIEYSIAELPEVCAIGRRILDGVRFIEDGGWAIRKYDLVIASGSLQYEKDWMGLLGRLSGAARKFVYMSKLPVAISSDRSFVVSQNGHECGYEAEFVGWCLSGREFLDCTKRFKLSLIREFIIGGEAFIDRSSIDIEIKGFLFGKS